MVVGWGGSEGESRERGLADCGGGGGLICSAVCRRSVLTAFQRGEGEGKGRGREARGRRREWKGWVKELGGGDVKKKKRVTEGGEEG